MTDDSLRILILVDRWSSGGVPVVITSHCRELVKKGHQVRIVTYYPSDDPELNNVIFTSLNAKKRGDFSVIIGLRKILKDWNPHIIHDHFGGLWSAAYILNKKWNVRSVLHYHNEFKAVDDSPDEKRAIRDRLFLKYLLPRYAQILTVSKHNKERLKAHSKIEAHQLKTLYNSINIESFHKERSSGQNIRRKLEIPSDALLIGSIGRLVYEKGFDTVLEVLISLHRKNYSGYCFIGGDGDQRIIDELTIRAEQAGVSDFLRICRREPNTADYLKSLDVFLMCSRQEPFGLTILEAMACDVPVVGIIPEAGGGPPEVIENGVNGFLHQHRNADAIADTIIDLHKNPSTKEEWIAGGKKTLEVFSDEEMGQQLETLYQKIIRNYSET